MSISPQTATYANPDGSKVTVSVAYDYTPAPAPPPTRPFWLGVSYKSTTTIPKWPGAERGFGLLFNSPGHGLDVAAYQAAVIQLPNVLWCVCAKDDPATTLPAFLASVPFGRECWYVYDQEENPTDDPATFVGRMRTARKLIDASGKQVKLVNKFAGFAAAHPGTGHAWTEYIAGTKDNPVEHLIGLDQYIRPGVGWPTTRYATPAEAFDLALRMRDATGLDVAVTEHARLAIATDKYGTGLADVSAQDVGFGKVNELLGISYWPGLGNAKNPDGSYVDFTPPGDAAKAIRAMILSQ